MFMATSSRMVGSRNRFAMLRSLRAPKKRVRGEECSSETRVVSTSAAGQDGGRAAVAGFENPGFFEDRRVFGGKLIQRLLGLRAAARHGVERLLARFEQLRILRVIVEVPEELLALRKGLVVGRVAEELWRVEHGFV